MLKLDYELKRDMVRMSVSMKITSSEKVFKADALEEKRTKIINKVIENDKLIFGIDSSP